MAERNITIDDIYELFRESERQRQEQQQAYERERQEWQRNYEREWQEHQQAYERERQEHQQAYERERQEHQQAYERERQGWQQNYEQERLERLERQRIVEQEMETLRQTVAHTNKQVAGLSSRWGEFVENLVRPAAVRLFQDQGINIRQTYLHAESKDQVGSMEIDIIAENGDEVVAIEVKSNLDVRDVKRFLETLGRFKQAFPRFQTYKLYGAVAGIKVAERADVYAVQEGLFVIKPAGDSVAISNRPDFKPKTW